MVKSLMELPMLIHYWNYPRRPESNGHIERFNRTIKKQFVYRNEDCELANQKIKDYLLLV
jgi:hypothetical protein